MINHANIECRAHLTRAIQGLYRELSGVRAKCYTPMTAFDDPEDERIRTIAVRVPRERMSAPDLTVIMQNDCAAPESVRYFLPRCLELYAQDASDFYVDDWLINAKIDAAGLRLSDTERVALSHFFIALWHVRIADRDRRAIHILREFGWLIGDPSGLTDVPATIAVEAQAVHAARIVVVLVPLYIDATASVKSYSLLHTTHVRRRDMVRMLHSRTGIALLPFYTQLGAWLASGRLTALLVDSYCMMTDLPEREELAAATDLLQAILST